MPKVQVLEMQFNEMAGTLFDRVMDLSQPNPALEKAWKDLLGLRDHLKQQAKQQVQQQPKKIGGAQSQGAQSSGNGNEPNWKGELYAELNKKLQRNVTKEEVRFEHEEMEGASQGQSGGWMASLSCEGLSQDYQADSVTPNKKTAETSASRVALQYEFPETFARLCGIPVQGKGNANRGQKRKAPEPVVEPPNAGEVKSRLAQAAQMMIGRNLEKGDISYETVPDESAPPGTFVGTVTLVGLDSSVGYQGFPAFGKKAAESAAAEAAIAALLDRIEPLEEAHNAKKVAKKKEGLAVFKKAHAEKMAAKKEP